MAGEKLIQKALGVLSKSAPQNVVTDAAERAANLARFMEKAKTPPVLYHASHADIPEFKRTKGSHLGFHFGDVEAANTRLEDTAEKFPWPKADRDERYAISEGHFNKLKAYEEAMRRKNTEVPTDELIRALDAGEDIGPIFKKYEYAPTPEEQAQLDALRVAYQSSQAPIIPPGGVGANVGAYHVAINNPLRMPDVGNWGSVSEIKKNLPFDTDARSQADLLSELRGRGYDGIVYQNQVENPVMRTDSFIAFDPEQAKSAIGNAGTFDPTKPRVNEARGGEVDAALHAVRHHLAGGGFLSDLFSGPDYLSTGEVASPTNWGDPELASDFFKADKAMRLAQQIQAAEPDRDMPLPLRRPAPEAAPRQQIASPPPAPTTEPAPAQPQFRLTAEPLIGPYDFGQRLAGRQFREAPPHLAETPGFGQSMLDGNKYADMQPEVPTSRLQKYTLPEAALVPPAPQAEINNAVSLAQDTERPPVQPTAYTAAPVPAPAQAAINTATTPTTGKLTARVDPNSDAERANNVWNRMLIQESGGRQFDRNGNTITSPVGALGISQVMPSTGPEAAALAGLPWSLERLRTDPEYNHALGRAYYEAQLERFGDPTLAAAAYNGGPGRVAGALRQARETGRPWTAFLRPETQNYVRVVTAQPRASGGLVDDALHVVREHHADGEAVGMNQRMRDTIASIDPERSQDQPVMDPATMGEAWNRARQNYQNFPVQEGEAVARQFVPSVRQEIGAAIAGEGGGRDYGSELRRRAAEFAAGSSGLDTGIGALDFVPYAGQALGTTDIAHDISQGDYAGAAEGAALPIAMTAAQRFAGPIGRGLSYAGEKIAEHARPIAGAAGTAAALSPDDAEAAKLSKALNIIRTAERPAESRFVSQAGEYGYFQPQSARERDFRLWHPISNTVLSRPLGEMTAEHRLLSGLPERKFIRPEDLEGASMIPALGDRTIGSSLLTGVNGVKFKDPVNMQAGHSFMYGPASKGPDRAIWASDPGVITVLSNKARAASEAGFDPYLNYVAMSSRSGDYSHHMADTLRQMLPQAKVPKDVIAEFDRQMRENTANKWAAYGDWPGLKSKKLEEYLYSTGPGKARTKMAELMGQGQFQKAGMPDVGAARFAITDPELLHAVDYSAGRSIARLDPMGRKITDPAVPHKTYLHQLAAHPEEGYVGGFEYDIPFEVMNKEWIDQIRARDPAAAENPSQLAYTYRLSAPRVDFKPQVVDRLSKFLEMKKAGLIP